MNINKYTEKAQEAILGAQQLADREGHPEIMPEHLLLTLVEQRDGIVPEIVRKMNADPAALAAAVRTEIGREVMEGCVRDGVIEVRPGDDDPGAIALMHKLAIKSRKRWPEWASPEAHVLPTPTPKPSA